MLRLRSHGTFMRQSLVRLPILAILYFGLWLAAELAAFAAVAHAISFAGAILACILTSLAGFATMRRLGLSAALRLRQTMARKASGPKGQSGPSGLSKEALLDGSLAWLGAVLLILPGFVSDLAGLALAAPSFRSWLGEKLKLGRLAAPGSGRPAPPAIVDLGPREWSRNDGPSPLP